MWFHENYDDRASLGIKIKEQLLEQQSEFQKITIYQTEFFGKLLTLDGLVMLSEKDEFVYHEMISHVPLCVHPAPRRVLVVGGGDGGSVREILKHESVEEVVLCEIDEQVVRVCQKHFPTIAGKLEDPRVTLAFRDGFEFLKEYENYFDVILTDSSDPIGPGVNLFKESYFQLIKNALREGGIAVSQSESPWFFQEVMHDMTAEMARVFSVVKTYSAFIPLYPSGFWTFTFMSNSQRPLCFDESRSAAVSAGCNYYNPQIHRAAFALPNFVTKNVVNSDGKNV